jgi:hypothetical protein
MEMVAAFDFESAPPGDPAEKFLRIADHGLDSPNFQSAMHSLSAAGRASPIAATSVIGRPDATRARDQRHRGGSGRRRSVVRRSVLVGTDQIQ